MKRPYKCAIQNGFTVENAPVYTVQTMVVHTPTRAEFRKGLRNIGIEVSDKEFNQLLNTVDEASDDGMMT